MSKKTDFNYDNKRDIHTNDLDSSFYHEIIKQKVQGDNDGKVYQSNTGQRGVQNSL